jgi:hypothetical protein
VLRVTRAYFGSTDAGRMKMYGKEQKTLGHRLDGGRCVGRICPDYLKFSTRTMSLLNASSCV